jgi:hypothetical protein
VKPTRPCQTESPIGDAGVMAPSEERLDPRPARGMAQEVGKRVRRAVRRPGLSSRAGTRTADPCVLRRLRRFSLPAQTRIFAVQSHFPAKSHLVSLDPTLARICWIFVGFSVPLTLALEVQTRSRRGRIRADERITRGGPSILRRLLAKCFGGRCLCIRGTRARR